MRAAEGRYLGDDGITLENLFVHALRSARTGGGSSIGGPMIVRAAIVRPVGKKNFVGPLCSHTILHAKRLDVTALLCASRCSRELSAR